MLETVRGKLHVAFIGVFGYLPTMFTIPRLQLIDQTIKENSMITEAGIVALKF